MTVAPPVPDVDVEGLRCEIQKEYASVAENPDKGFHFHTGRKLAGILGYAPSLLEGIPEAAIESFAGTGNPFSLGEIAEGEKVVEVQDLVAHYGVQPEKIRVAYPGFDADLAPVTDPAALADVKRRYGIKGDYFIHIGTLQPRKNLARLVEAFSAIPSDAQIQLVLAGKKGWLYDDLFHQVRSLGLEGRVLFPGYVDDGDKVALLSGAIAYVFPSLYEGFGFPALEAQACDTPLICAHSSSLPEVAGDGALQVDPLDVEGLTRALTRLLQDETLRAELIARGRRNRQRFSWRACAETVMEALEAAALAAA